MRLATGFWLMATLISISDGTRSSHQQTDGGQTSDDKWAAEHADGNQQWKVLIERTNSGLAASRARGRKGGLKREFSPRAVRKAQEHYDKGELSVTENGRSANLPVGGRTDLLGSDRGLEVSVRKFSSFLFTS